MTILVTGASGLVGSHFVESVRTDPTLTLLTPSAEELDITNKQQVKEFFSNNNPQSVIHYAAYTFLDEAEKEKGDKNGKIWKINVTGTENIARAAASKHCYFIHISTDNVFSGKKDDPGPYTENHQRETNENNLSWYGYTKVKAEEIVEHNLSRFAIMRISNPVRVRYDTKPDHIHKILVAYEEKKKLTYFDDQFLTLTYINEATRAVKKLIDLTPQGIFHVSSINQYTPFKLVQYLLYKKYEVKDVVGASSLEEYVKKTGLENRYMQYGDLNVTETQKKLGIDFSSWERIIDQLIDEGL